MPLELYSKEELEAAKAEAQAKKNASKTDTAKDTQSSKGGKSKDIATESLKGTGSFLSRFNTRFGGEAVGVAVGLPVSGYVGRLVENTLVSKKSGIINNILGWSVNTGTKIAGYFILKKIKQRMNPAGIAENVIDGIHIAMAGSIVLDTTLRLSGCNNRNILTLNDLQKNSMESRKGSQPPRLNSGSIVWSPLTQQQMQEINRKIYV